MSARAASPGRILVLNPNSSEAVTAAIDAAVEPLRQPGGPAIAVDRLRSGPPGIATQRDADSVVVPLCDLVARAPTDAVVLAGFSDTGHHPGREAAGGRPVMGIAEWGLLRALTLGDQFGIVALSPASVQRQARYVRQMGLGARYAGSWPIAATAEETAGEAVRDRLIAAARHLVADRGAGVVVLGCAGMAGHRRAVADAIGRPVVEPTQWAVAAALGALRLAAS